MSTFKIQTLRASIDVVVKPVPSQHVKKVNRNKRTLEEMKERLTDLRSKQSSSALNKKEQIEIAGLERMVALGGRRGPYKEDHIKIKLKANNWIPTQEIVRELFSYDSETGLLTRIVNRSGNGGLAGTVVNTVSDSGYIVVRVGRRTFPAHRIIWLYVHGYLPEHEIDHINQQRCDNRLCNLREVTAQCNARNRKTKCDSKSGVKGVGRCPRTGRWNPYISTGDRDKVSLGGFSDFTEAVCHRYAAEQCLNYMDCDSNSPAYQYLKEQGTLK